MIFDKTRFLSMDASARVFRGGGGGGSFSATVDSDSFNVPSHGQRISYENTFACH